MSYVDDDPFIDGPDLDPGLNPIDWLSPETASNIAKWRLRPALLVPHFSDIAVFFAVTLAVQFAYHVIWPSNDIAAGQFPVESINPLKRHDHEIQHYLTIDPTTIPLKHERLNDE
jgi:hypothetical protein